MFLQLCLSFITQERGRRRSLFLQLQVLAAVSGTAFFLLNTLEATALVEGVVPGAVAMQVVVCIVRLHAIRDLLCSSGIKSLINKAILAVFRFVYNSSYNLK